LQTRALRHVAQFKLHVRCHCAGRQLGVILAAGLALACLWPVSSLSCRVAEHNRSVDRSRLHHDVAASGSWGDGAAHAGMANGSHVDVYRINAHKVAAVVGTLAEDPIVAPHAARDRVADM
jgi:hypothetical protein